MTNNRKNIAKPSKLSVENTTGEKVSRYAKSSYFREKDRKAAEFLKKHPVPAKFLK
jgi:hypothetical protein